MKYISYRTIVVASLSGRSVGFQKGVPTYAPPQMHDELVAMGIIPEGGLVEPPAAPVTAEPTVSADREAVLMDLFDKMVTRGRREDFTATGAPHLSVIAKELNWGTMLAKERDVMWDKWTQKQLEKEE